MHGPQSPWDQGGRTHLNLHIIQSFTRCGPTQVLPVFNKLGKLPAQDAKQPG